MSGAGTGIDAFAQVEFGSNPPLKTKVRKAKGRGDLSVEFNEALYLPVMVPTMSNRIAISMWDKDPGSKEIVAYVNFNFAALQALQYVLLRLHVLVCVAACSCGCTCLCVCGCVCVRGTCVPQASWSLTRVHVVVVAVGLG